MYLVTFVVLYRRRKIKNLVSLCKVFLTFLFMMLHLQLTLKYYKHLAADQELTWKEMLLVQKVCSVLIAALQFGL